MRPVTKNRSISCYFCHSQNVEKYLQVNNTYVLYKCTQCLVVFTFPQPLQSQVQNVNAERYDSAEELRSRTEAYNVEYVRALKHIKSLMLYKTSGKYLDIGCSYGISVKAAKDMGFSAYGIEPTLRAANYAKKVLHLTVRQTSLEKAKLKANMYDVVTLYDVLEHIPNLTNFLLNVRKILKPKGLLVIQSPNVESYACSLLKKDWNWLLVPNHLWHFSRKSLKNILTKQGFLVKNTTTEDVLYDFSSNLTSKIFSYKMSRNILEKILQRVTYLSLYLSIGVGTKIWSVLGKGGTLQVYAVKK